MDMPNAPLNFRDLGGTPCGACGKVMPCRLLRAGELRGLDARDRDILTEEYGLRCVIDMRGCNEREEAPDEVLPGVAYHWLDVSESRKVDGPGAKLLSALATPRVVEHFMRKTYAGLVTDESARQGYAQMLDILCAQREGASLVHCFAGKDRSGFGVAIVLAALGAAEDDIMADYVKSNEASGRLVEAMMKRGGFGNASQKRMEAMQAAASAKPEYLYEAFKTASLEFGTFSAYMKNALGLDDQKRERLRELYLD